MEFNFSEEQRLLKDSANSFLEEFSSSERIREAMQSELGFNQEVWKKIAKEMGWLGILIPEKYGGLELSWIELVALQEEMGRNLFCSPFHSTTCLGSVSILEAGTEEQKSKYLPKVVNGDLLITLACLEDNGEWGPDGINTIYKKVGKDFLINGVKRYVPYGHCSDVILVAARQEGTEGKEGISLFLTETKDSNLKKEKLITMDQTRPQAEITLNNLKLSNKSLLGLEGQGWDLLTKVRTLGALGLTAEQVGGSQKCLDMTCHYVLEREQFDRKIGSFQAVKHRLADMMVLVESARSAVYYAGCIATKNNSELEEVVSIAKSYCSEAYFKCASDSIQLHGGIGFTWEFDVHLYFKRAKSSEIYLGNPQIHKDKIASLLGI